MHDAQSIAQVLLDDALDRPLDYLIPQNLQIEKGSRVSVPVRGSLRKATVVALLSTSPFIGRLHPIAEVLSEKPYLATTVFKLAEWMSEYYVTPLRRVLRLFLPTTIRKEMKQKEQFLISRDIPLKKLVDLTQKLVISSPQQAKVLSVLLQKPKGVLLTELLELAEVSKSPIETLIKKRVLKCEKVVIDRSPAETFRYFPTAHKKLHEEQAAALKEIVGSLDANRFTPFLLHGITGSGKTEVYMQAIAHARKLKKSVLMLVPEISLTSQTIERFVSRFDEPMGILHHRLSDGERTDVWRNIHSGKIGIVIGARSALFSPIQNLGLIIVDEEHDGSYKQTDEMPCYHARDVAVMRGKLENAAVVLGTATPSLESYTNALQKKYTLLELTTRSAKAKLPTVHIVDMKRAYEKAGGFTLFSEELIDGIKTRHERGEQTLLFLNRRGYHSFQMCTKCEHIEKCPHCDISLTFHKNENQLMCHQCGYTLSPPPVKCSHCGEIAFIKMKGYGTEQVQKVLHALIKDIRTLRMDADTTRHKGSHEQLFRQFKAGKADVLIGTQMIAKGLHFPSVTLVGVINADTSIHIPDFRSSENVFQLLTQVSGRSGRGALPGEVLIQSMLKDHFVLQTASKEEYKTFYAKEIATRKLLAYPPFAQLAKCILSSEDEQECIAFGESLRKALLKHLPNSFEIYPLMPCGIAKIKDRFRYKLIIKGAPITVFSKMVPKLLPSIPKTLRLLIDIAPISTF